MSNEIPACQFGYIILRDFEDNLPILIKANKIVGIEIDFCGVEMKRSIIRTVSAECAFFVKETHEEILEKLENIHPSLR